MQRVDLNSMFRLIKFEKTGEEIRTHILPLVVALETKVAEREGRIAKIRAEYDITDADVIEAMAQMQRGAYSTNAIGPTTITKKQIPHGVFTNLEAEQSAIYTEREQIKKLTIVARNLDSATNYHLSYEELEWLSF